MKINYSLNYSVEVKECKVDFLIAVFKQLLVFVLTDFIKTALEKFAEEIMEQKKKPFHCEGCGKNTDFIWKTRNAKSMKLTTIFAELILPQMQIPVFLKG